MAATQRPCTKTASRWTPETARGTHRFEIPDYSLIKSFHTGEFIQSATFAVGGNNWCINYLPHGDNQEEYDDNVEELQDYVSIYLECLSTTSGVRVLYDFRLVDPATGQSSSQFSSTGMFDHVNYTWGTVNFMEKSKLEASFLRDDCLVIECDVTVIIGMPVSKSETTCEIHVPSSDLLHSLGQLLGAEKRADVTFMVQGVVFHAHKFVLAMRSPVLEAELYGPMRNKRTKSITIEDMKPAVFEALLHFIYKDSLPAMDDLDEDDHHEMVKHLLVAADMYGVERMKVICESILCKRLDVENVATTLTVADQHHCDQLKDACIAFICSSNRMDLVLASRGYAHLKRACPSVIVEIWGKSAKPCKI